MALFLSFAAVLFGLTPAEASIPRGGVAEDGPPLLALHELAPSAIAPSRFGFVQSVWLLDVESAPGCFGLFGLETRRCEITYARNNPLKYVDPDGRENEVAWDAFNRVQVQETYGDAALSRYDTQRAVQGGMAIGGLAGAGVVVTRLVPAVLSLTLSNPQLLTELGSAAEGFLLPGPGSGGLLSSQLRHMEGINNIVRDHAKAGDFAAVALEKAGGVISKSGGEKWDHVTEMRQSMKGLARHIRALKGSLDDQRHSAQVRASVQAAVDKGEYWYRRMWDALHEDGRK